MAELPLEEPKFLQQMPVQRRKELLPVREVKSPYETVPEAPGLRRQMLFQVPFNVYRDVVDAGDKVPVKERVTDVPAVYTILEAPANLRGRIMQIGDETGKPLGWINVRESQAQEWNLQRALLVGDTGHPIARLETFAKPDGKTSTGFITITRPTVVPYSESADNHWFHVGSTNDGRGEYEKWVRSLNHDDQRIAEEGVLVNRESIRRLYKTLVSLLEQWRILSAAERKAIDGERLLAALRVGFTVFFTSTHNTKLEEYVPGIDVMKMTIDDIAAMDDSAFAQWLNRLDACKGRMQQILGGDLTPTTEIFRNGKKEVMYMIPYDQLP